MAEQLLRLADLTREEVGELAPKATVVVPLGSTEQHGRHLPIFTDTLVVQAIADRAAQRANASVPVLVAPALPYGFSAHHGQFAGTVTLPISLYIEVLTQIGVSLAASGFKRIFFLNGHGGNESASRAAADRLVYELRHQVDVVAAAYWHLAADQFNSAGLQVGVIPGHAGGFETSCLLALHPGLVQLDRRPPLESEPQPVGRPDLPRAHVRRHSLWALSDGRSDDASRANEIEGERILDMVVRSVSDFIVRFHRSTER